MRARVGVDMEFREAVLARRSEYSLDARDVDADAVIARIRGIAGSVPSAFNAQSARVLCLIGEDHRRFWEMVEDVLRERSRDPERFKGTQAKLAGFRAAAGTILFYEVDSRTRELMKAHPSYRDMFPQWAEHGNAMMQFAVWCAITDMGLGANIQHYNPIIDARAAEMLSVPDGYRLVAQMVFGRVTDPAGPKGKLSGDDIVSVGHAKE